MRTIHQLKNNNWVIISYACQYCDTTFKTVKYCAKHEEKCKSINTLKQLKEQSNMPVQRIYKGGEVYYRWGDQGKLYKNREDAEAQGRAAYALGRFIKAQEKK